MFHEHIHKNIQSYNPQSFNFYLSATLGHFAPLLIYPKSNTNLKNNSFDQEVRVHNTCICQDNIFLVKINYIYQQKHDFHVLFNHMGP